MKSILLLHGWNDLNYTSQTDKKDAWWNREKFVNELSKNYKVYKLNFPGFCHEPEPKEKEWNLDNFASYVNDYIVNNNLKIDYVLGYSFGGAVAIKYNLLFNNKQKLILVSPAITRNADRSKKMIKTPRFLKSIRNFIRDLYLKYIVKNEYMIHGTKFLNRTYQNIVRVSLIDELTKIDSKDINIIYGSKDKMVNPLYVYNSLSDEYKKKVFFIKDGSHDIANTNTEELVKIINDVK